MATFFMDSGTEMKLKIGLIGLSALLSWNALAADPAKAPTTPAEKTGYAVGVEFANKFKKDKIEIDTEMVIQGLRDTMSGTMQMSREEIDVVLKVFQAELRRKVANDRHVAQTANRERNDKFFATNKAVEGVQLLSSGVQYKVIKAGTGAKPNDAHTVSMNYRGTLIDGTEFDKTEAGKPAKLNIATMIPGLRAAMHEMPVGSHWQVWIPAGLAYGDRGAGKAIGPQEPLVYDIELLDINQ